VSVERKTTLRQMQSIGGRFATTFSTQHIRAFLMHLLLAVYTSYVDRPITPELYLALRRPYQTG